MIALFIGLGYWFWALFIIEFILLTIFVEQEWGIASLASLIAFIVFLWWLADIPVWTWIKNNPGTLAKYCLYYIVAGMMWSIIKYYFVLKRVQKRIKVLKADWMKVKDKLPDDNITSFEEYALKNTRYNEPVDFEGTAKKLVFWASFWPTSMFWTLLNDPIRKLFKFLIYDVFIGIYKTMHRKMVGDFLK